jgi:DNA-binding NarL/FixJ family response regulator
MIRVLCVEDEPLVLEYLVARLQGAAGIEVVGAVADAGSAFAFLRRRTVDVLLLDYRLRGADGLHLLRVLSIWHSQPRSLPRPNVLICSGLADAALEEEAMQAGVAGVLSKKRAVTDLLPAVRVIAGGGRWFEHLDARALPAGGTEGSPC